MMERDMQATSMGRRLPSSSSASAGVTSAPATVDSAVSTIASGACSLCSRNVAYEDSCAPLTQATCARLLACIAPNSVI